MATSTSAGAKFYIGTTTEAENLSQFQTDSYVQVKELEDIGEFGDEATEVNYTTLDLNRVQRRKGSRDAGVLALTCIRDPLDAGQQAMIAASKEDDEYNVKIVADDAANGGTPTTFFMRTVIMSAKVNFSGADDMTRVTFQVGINSEILEVEAT
ncbi:hypothetical protein J5J86_20720 [Aquabacter sp. L1I39]|uniref:hypothetical protein n=1 Tax=Aquabacter sp. L1I39 TaxID=2820278 RepID=UPI001ADC287E|nr:hypothetical protein [Aquabacter sp. L1I39]QTL03150.1 hypothetical protein J5J86_20720 [Aquabacter sp. L1I39]